MERDIVMSNEYKEWQRERSEEAIDTIAKIVGVKFRGNGGSRT